MSVVLLVRFILDCINTDIFYDIVNHTRSWLAWLERRHGRSPWATEDGTFLMLMRGYYNVRLESSFEKTMPIVRRMIDAKQIWNTDSVLADALVLGYAFLLRWGEVVSIFVGSSGISVSQQAQCFMLYLDRSKTDVHGQGSSVRFPFKLFSEGLKEQVILAIGRLRRGLPQQDLTNAFLRSAFGEWARFHGLRHGRASDLLWQRVSKKELQELGR